MSGNKYGSKRPPLLGAFNNLHQQSWRDRGVLGKIYSEKTIMYLGPNSDCNWKKRGKIVDKDYFIQKVMYNNTFVSDWIFYGYNLGGT